jgi:glutamate synthase (NADPH) large chain
LQPPLRRRLGYSPFGLYDPRYEHDACGIGAVVDIAGKPSHQLVGQARRILINLLHRGATGGDECTGDGAGILMQMPHRYFTALAKDLGFELPPAEGYGSGIVFCSEDAQARQDSETLLNEAARHYGLEVVCWRDVPVESDVVGELARTTEPRMRQVFVDGRGLFGSELERKLYMVRKRAERLAHQKLGLGAEEFYVCSLSCRTIVYKGMFIAPQLFDYFPDLKDERVETALALVHQRYSTNTLPTWPLAQPFRLLAHNGEINTLRGNIGRMKGRERQMRSPLLGEDLSDLIPVIDEMGSDSGCFDNVLELLLRAGRSLPHAMMMMMPEAFGSAYHMSTAKRAFYEYHSAIMEPWDGPAAMVFSDGRVLGGTLDRNGLRPARYVVTKDGLVVLASEVGVIDFPADQILEKGRLKPGRMFLVDLQEQRIVSDKEIKSKAARKQPYLRWLEQNRIELRGLFSASRSVPSDSATINDRLRLFGYTREDLEMIIAPMAKNGQEPVGSMGTDTPLAVLSDRPKLLFNYFKQQFAQVTNPAIDPLREGLVMSLMAFVGKRRNLLSESPEHCRQLKLPHPILTNEDVGLLRNIRRDDIKTATIPAVFEADADDPAEALRTALKRIADDAEAAILRDGASLLILSDRSTSDTRAPIPILLAAACVHHELQDRGLRSEAGLIVETAEAREVMHFSLLSGFGVNAVNPYLALELLDELQKRGDLPADIEPDQLVDNYINAIKKGLLKTMSKMGISTIRSYRGAQLFEAVGLNRSLVDAYFQGTPSRIEGLGLDTLAEETLRRHREARAPVRPGKLPIAFEGEYHYRIDGEQHAWNPQTIHLFQSAVRHNNRKAYDAYAQAVNAHSMALPNLRGLFAFRPGTPVPLEEVEPATAIVKRFCTGAMSHGSISKEAHETLAIAMNRIGAKSNTGEGGEDPARYELLPNGDSKNSAIKQIASGRFGVTANYLAHAQELQIKIAQGAKPGEGGQLPGHKVTEDIARLRFSTPGVSLISPPPHHDIYSIEDLAQLIYDLKCASPGVKVSVKLVAEVGVGTVAAGVAKANADEVLISGHDGGTGASPLSSIKHAGVPWELGLAETQQVLVQNGLRDRIRVQTDGHLKTGRDVAVAALLGAEQFGFGTSALVSQGCILMRKCHLGTCPVGIATQDEQLRRKFAATPEHVVNFFMFVAEDLRTIMAELGFRTVAAMVGRSDRLDFRPANEHWKARGLDLSALLARPNVPPDTPISKMTDQKDRTVDALDRKLIALAAPAIENREQVRIDQPINNVNRTVGAMLSNAIVRKHGPEGLPDGSIECTFRGSAGQSFGAWLAPGVTLRLIGDANDYLGKGLSGGRIIVQTPPEATYEQHENIIAGNTMLYGATSGEVFINGLVGERFAVRNSGAVAVVEGVGDHGCEYMTGGLVVVLGDTGRNFAAGMSGGVAYVLDEHQWFDTLCNLDMVDLESVWHEADRELLRAMVERHYNYTHSRRARRMLEDWPALVGKFVKVMPIDYRKALERLRESDLAQTDFIPATEEVFRG